MGTRAIKSKVLALLQSQDLANSVAALQAMAAKDQQILQLQQALAESQKNVAALQTQLNEFVDDSEIKLRIAQMDNETKVFLKRMELAASDEELLTKLQADFMSQQAKLQADLAKKRLDLVAKVPEVPVFDQRRTFV